jgi:SAM-dependent methyltransferase
VLSQFGHIFAPRPELSTREMLRVLRPGGTLAFSTWPPELFTGRLFEIIERYSLTQPLEGSSPPMQWGDPSIVAERLGDKVRDLTFARDTLHCQVLSPQHARIFFEAHIGPISVLVRTLEASDRTKLSRLRRDLEEVVSLYFEDNVLRQDFLVSRAIKV